MKLLKSLFILLIISSFINAKTVNYLEILGKDKEFLSNWTIEINENSSIISGNTLLDYVYLETKNGSTIVWKNKRKYEDTQLTAIRIKDTIKITGTTNNEPFSKEFNVGDYPWFQTPGFLLENFAKSNKQSMQFLMLRITNHNPILMEINKDKEELLNINNKNYATIKTYIYPASFLKYFWKAPMWFDKNTGKVLKYDGLIGGPGSDSFQIIYSNQRK